MRERVLQKYFKSKWKKKIKVIGKAVNQLSLEVQNMFCSYTVFLNKELFEVVVVVAIYNGGGKG
jgi:hypothetical protein